MSCRLVSRWYMVQYYFIRTIIWFIIYSQILTFGLGSHAIFVQSLSSPGMCSYAYAPMVYCPWDIGSSSLYVIRWPRWATVNGSLTRLVMSSLGKLFSSSASTSLRESCIHERLWWSDQPFKRSIHLIYTIPIKPRDIGDAPRGTGRGILSLGFPSFWVVFS